MTSYLVIHTNKAKRESHAQSICDDFGIDKFDRTVIERGESDGKLKLSLGIEDVKNMQKKLFLKPMISELKALILYDAQLLTVEAQNALLKVLEEPPVNTVILLTADSVESLLPTIRSRCTIIDLGRDQQQLSDEEKRYFSQTLQEISEWGIGKALKEAETLAKNKEAAITWLENMIIVTRSSLISHITHSNTPNRPNNPNTPYLTTLLSSLQKTHTVLKTTNTNPRLTLESLFLSLQ